MTMFMVITNSAHAQRYHGYQTRPQWQGYYNGYGKQNGYSYNPRSGWNSIRLPSGASRLDYRDGYVPPRYYPRLYNNTYSDTINQYAYPGMGW
jgi:hypothetical protein